MRTLPILLCLLLAACSCSQPLNDHKGHLFVDLYEPTVLVSVPGGYGSGTIIWSECGKTYILTAAHVIRNAVFIGAVIVVTDWVGGAPFAVNARVMAWDPAQDLALLEAEYDALHVAEFSSREPRIFEEVRVCGIGIPKIPLPTQGEFQGISGNGRYFTSSPVYWGYSGGGLYVWDSDHWRLCGVVSQVGIVKGQVIPDLSIHVDLPTILEWLGELGYTEVL